MLAAALLAAFLALIYFVHRSGLRSPVLAFGGSDRLIFIYTASAVAAAGAAFAGPRARTAVLLTGAALAYGAALEWWAIAPAAFGLLVCGLGRTKLRARNQVGLALAAWSALLVARALSPRSQLFAQTSLLFIIWAGLAYSSVYLLIERARHRDAPSLADELFYLFAPPRLLEPFFQPISPRYLRERRQDAPSAALLLRGLGLGALGLALAVLSSWLARHPRLGEGALRVAADFAGFYATVTHSIFISMALFRLHGFDLSSGYRAPFLSRSFPEFFRRYNHYVRDAVVSLFYFPFLGWLRSRLPPRAATILASYAAILVGSYALNDFLVPVVTNPDWMQGVRRATAPSHLLVLAFYWTLVALPASGLLPRPKRAAGVVRRGVEIVLFNVAFFALWYFVGWEHQRNGRAW